MRIVADYGDGFSEWLLAWRFVSNDGKAFLTASWFQCEEPLRVKFQFDETSFADVVPLLSALATDYHVPITDLETCSLSVSDGTTTVSRTVYGAHYLAREHPEVREFLRLWQLLETTVATHLPKRFAASGFRQLS